MCSDNNLEKKGLLRNCGTNMKSNKNIMLGPPMEMCGPGLTGYLAPFGAQISVDYKKVPPMLRPIYHLVMGPLSVLFATPGHFGIYNLCEGEQVGASGSAFVWPKKEGSATLRLMNPFNNMFVFGPTKSGVAEESVEEPEKSVEE